MVEFDGKLVRVEKENKIYKKPILNEIKKSIGLAVQP
jgi:hypothetical protein